jgi:pimeloyl-ACP methyl ester carboxylesterase
MNLFYLLRSSAIFLGISLSGCASLPGELGVITVDDGRGASSAPMDVYFYRPATFKPGGPVLIVVHGSSRNAGDYRYYFAAAAWRYGALILAPEFSRENYRGSRRFNLGNVKTRSGDTTLRSEWSFPVIDRIFDQVRAPLGFGQQGYYLFGHSAGSQFVHRMIMFSPSKKMIAAVAANAGWYTEPDITVDFPYGLNDAPADKEILRQAFRQKLTVMLGQDDNDETHRSLRRTAEANRQGPHRLARGRHFYRRSKEIAGQLRMPFLWRLKEVSGIAHSGSGMAGPAADVFFGSALDPASK